MLAELFLSICRTFQLRHTMNITLLNISIKTKFSEGKKTNKHLSVQMAEQYKETEEFIVTSIFESL